MKGKICRNEGKEEKNPMSTSSSSIFETFENLVSIFSSFFFREGKRCDFLSGGGK